MNLTEYFQWHYLYVPKRLPSIWRNFLVFLCHFFSIKELTTHLFAPWKRQTLQKGPGFDLEEVIRVFSFNLISRVIGAFARIVIILAGFLFLVLTIILGPLIWIIWLLLLGLTYPLFLLLKREEKIPEKFKSDKKIFPQEVLKEFLKTSQGKFFQSRLSISLSPLISNISFTPSRSDSFTPPFSLTWFPLITFLAENWESFREILKENSLDIKDVQIVLNWLEDWEKERQRNLRFWWLENLLKIRPLGRDLIYGYTINLDKYSTDLGAPLPYSHHLVGRQKEAKMIEEVLCRTSENNVLLVGQPGVGRTTIILNFARLVSEGQITANLSRKRVLDLNLNLILASAKTPQEAKGLVELILKEASEAGNIILVIKHIDLYLSSGEGRLDLTDILLKPTADSTLQIIGTTTPFEFQKYLFPNQEIIKNFEKIEVCPPTKEEAYLIIERVVPVFEQRTKTLVTYQAIKETIEKADQYITDLPFPEKAIDLLDEVCVRVAGQKKILVTKQDVDELISEKTKIPVGQIGKEEKEKLANLEKILHQRIVNQEEAVEEIAKALRRARTGISAKNRPIGTFLFLGPTGVGKTETAKALAFTYFGADQMMIRFDMAEYQGGDALDRAIGAVALNEPGLFAKAIRENPFSLLLIDEVEKSNPKLLNLFLTILDEGYFTDAFGRRVDCRNLIIICTSNAGAEFIRQKVTQTTKDTSDGDRLDPPAGGESHGSSEVSEFSKEVTEYVLRQQIFTPEFLNRFDAVVVFKPLSTKHLEKIAELLLKNLNLRLKEKECQIKITPQLIKRVAKLGYEPAFGARPMKRVIQDKIEDQIAQKLIKGEIKKGEEIKIEI